MRGLREGIELAGAFEDVAHFFLLGAEVALEGFLRLDFGGDAFGDGDAGGLERGDFLRIVGDETDAGDAEELEDLGRELVGAAVCGEAEFDVGFDGVAAVVLELIGAELCHETDAAALLLLIEENACALLRNFGEGELELKAAVAAQRAEDVSGEALGVDSDEWRRGVDVAHDESDEALFLRWRGRVWRAVGERLGGLALKAEDAEVAPAGGEVGLCDLGDVGECHVSIVGGAGRAGEILDGMKRDDVEIRIEPAHGAESLPTVQMLFAEYWNSFGFTPCFQNFGEELDGLPGRYAPPSGRLAVAWVKGEAAGCVALRRFDAERGEVKRLYVRPGFRGLGLGRKLLEWVMNEARAAGYAEMVGDTMPVMTEALAMYDRMGFERMVPDEEQAKSGAIAIRRRL